MFIGGFVVDIVFSIGNGPVSEGKNVLNSKLSRFVLGKALAVKDEPLGKVRVRYR
jgi:hypothetical protein